MSSIAPLRGRKSSSSTSRKATRHDDTLFGQDTVEVLLALGEGPIAGLKDGASTFYVGDLPVLDKNSGTPNISNFDLRILHGTNPADSIRLNLGGIASTRNVGLELRLENQAIVVQGTKSQIDFIDVRLVVQRLLAVSAEGGEFPAVFQGLIEIKARSSGVWTLPFTNEPPPPIENTTGASNYRPGTNQPGTLYNDVYRESYIADTAPVSAKGGGAVWFNTSDPYWRPSIWNGTAWVEPQALSYAWEGTSLVWEWTDSSTDTKPRHAWFAPDGNTPDRELLASGDFLLTPDSGQQAYVYNDTTWVGYNTYATPQIAAPGVITINGLGRAAYPKEYRIPVPRINEPYDVRVTRQTPRSTKDVFVDVTFESIQEVNQDVLSFPDLALAWLTIKATDTFTQIPEFTGIYRGLTIPVPTNYTFDETTKSGMYTGLWDGSFKIAYTNSPAWHAYNFIMNSRYGKNSYFPEIADKWDYYEFGKHCDLHKFRFNEYITEPRSLNELINYIVGIANGRYVDRGDGYSTVIWDADDQVAVAIFAPENTIEGAFTWSFTDVTERKNDFRVSFKNPDLNYREDRVRVWDQNSIDVSGRNSEEFVAVGCRDAEEAIRRGRLRLATALSEKAIVNFKTNRIGRYLLPFQVILIADDQSSNVISGRVANPEPLPLGTTTLPLREQIYLEAGVEYSVQLTVPNASGGLKVISHELMVVTSGPVTQLYLARALADPLPEYAVFSIGAPKPVRITSITPVEGEPDQISIEAIEVNRQKWAFVDGLVELRDIIGLQTGALSRFIVAVTGVTITPEIVTGGGYNLIVSWNRSETKLTRGHRVYLSQNRGPMNLVAEPVETFYRIENAVQGTYLVSITAVGLDGTTESPPTTISYIVSDGSSIRSVGVPKNLRLVNEPEAPIFRSKSPTFTWDAAEDPLVSKYLVEVLNGSGAVVTQATVEGQLLWTYQFSQNQTDNGGSAIRTFTVRVRSIDSTGSFSTAAIIAVAHPAPSALSVQTYRTPQNIFVYYGKPNYEDFAGVLVYISKTSGFTPDASNLVFDGLDSPFNIPAEAAQYYLRVAGYDTFGKTGLNFTAEIAIQTFLVRAVDIAANAIERYNLGQGIIDATALASSIQAIKVFATVPTVYEGDFATVGTPGVLYRWNGSAYLPAVSAGNLSGTITDAQIASVSSAKLLGQLLAGQIAGVNTTALVGSITAGQIAGVNANTIAGQVTASQIASVNAAAIAGQVTDAQIAALAAAKVTGTLTNAQISALDAAKLTGTLDVTRIADGALGASKFSNVARPVEVLSALPTSGNFQGRQVFLTTDSKLYRHNGTSFIATVASGDISGTIADSQIAALAASKVTGTLTDAQLGAIASAKVTGTLTDAQIAAISAAKVTGTLSDAQLGTISAAKVTGTLIDAQISALSAAKLTGAIVGTQITDGAISTAKLSAGAVTAANVAAGAITAGKLVLADTNNLFLNGNWQNLATGAGSSEGWVLLGSTSLTSDFNDPTWGPWRLSTNEQFPFVTVADIVCQPGEKIYLKADIFNNRTSGSAGLYVKFWNASRTSAADVYSVYTTAKGFWSRAEAQVTVPAGYGRMEVYGYADAPGTGVCYFSRLVARRTTSNLLIVDGAIQTNHMTAGSIDASVLVADSITAVQIAASAITATELAAGAIVAGKIAAGSIVAGDIAADTITGSKIAGQTITAANIAADTITAAQIAAGAITASELAAGSVVAGKIAAGTIVAADIAASTITGAKIAGQTITAANIAADTITAGQIAAGAITASEIAANAVTAVAILAGSITADRLLANSITSTQIASETILAANIAAGAIISSKLAVGTGTNVVYNSDFLAGVSYDVSNLPATVYQLTPSSNPNGWRDTYMPKGMGSIGVSGPVAWANAEYSDLTLRHPSTGGGWSVLHPVVSGEKYELSVYASCHSANSYGYVQWLYGDGSSAGFSSTSVGLNTYASLAYLDPARRLSLVATAPFGAQSAIIVLRTLGIGNGAQSTVFYSGVYFGKAKPNQTELSDWTPGVSTIIDGEGIRTRSIKAGNIEASTITSTEIAARTILATNVSADSITSYEIKARTIVAANVAAGALTANEIAARTILANNIAAGAVTATEIAAGAITAGKIVLVDTNNLFLNGNWQNLATGAGSSEGWILLGGSNLDNDPADATYGPRRLVSNDQYPFVSTTDIVCQPGEKIYLKVDIFNSRTSGSAGLLAKFWNGNRTAQTDVYLANTTAKGAWSRAEAQVTVPAGYGRMEVYGYADAANTGLCYFARLVARRTNTNLLIVDGAIQTNHMTAGSIDASVLVADSITAAQIAAGAINASEIAAGAISADKIGVGLNDNMIFNADFSAGAVGFTSYGNVPTHVSRVLSPGEFTDTYTPRGMKTAIVNVTGATTAGQYIDFFANRPVAAGGFTQFYPARSGQRYEASLYCSAHRCNAILYIFFFDPNGNFLAAAGSSTIPSTGATLYALETATRTGVFGTAPAGTASMSLVVRTVMTGGSDAYLFFTALMLAEAKTYQTEFSAWAPGGGTVITGAGIAVRSIKAENIETGSLTANEIAAQTITSNNIAAGSVHADRLIAETITATNLVKTQNLITAYAQVANGVIINAHIADAQITTAKIVDAQITTAKIGNAQVNTLKIGGNAVTFPTFAAGLFGSTPAGGGGSDPAGAQSVGVGLVTDPNGSGKLLISVTLTINGGAQYRSGVATGNLRTYTVYCGGTLIGTMDMWDAVIISSAPTGGFANGYQAGTSGSGNFFFQGTPGAYYDVFVYNTTNTWAMRCNILITELKR